MEETSCEPMDVDMSANSTSAMDISYTEVADVSTSNSRSTTPKVNLFTKVNKREYLDDMTLPCQYAKEQNMCEKVKISNSSYKKSILVIIVCLLSIVSYNILSFKCYANFKFKSINERLHTRLYGQTIAINNVVNFLDLEGDSKILVLYGGTGVGKTFMVSLLFEDFLNHTNIYHYSMTNLEKVFTTESMFGVTLCKTSVVIIDDITLDKDISKYVKELIARTSNLNKSITIILIYNCANFDQQFIPSCPNNYLSEFESTFININALKKFVQFQPLTEDTLKKCIQYELRDNINETDLTKMMRNFNVVRDGCKGVHQKTKYLNVK